MSLRHVLYVLNDERFIGLKGSPRLLLVALAACASDRGNVCWPAEEWLMKATGMSRATLYRSKTPLRDLIEIDPPGYKRSNLYNFPPVDVSGHRVTEVAKVLAAKREQELEAKGELEATYGTAFPDAGVVNTAPSAPVDKSQNETGDTKECRIIGLKMRRLPSQIETGGGLKLRPKDKDESKKKSFFSNESQGETVDKSQAETVINNYDGSKRPTCKEHYDWIVRHCLIAGMDDYHFKVFLAQNRRYRWVSVGEGVNVCDLIADYVTLWKKKSPDEFAYVQQQKQEDARLAEEARIRKRIAKENGVSAYAVKNG